MRRFVALVIATSAMLAASIAAADTAKDSARPFAFAVNAPYRWVGANVCEHECSEDKAFAISGYLGLAKHHGLRVNVASYPYTGGIDNAFSEAGYRGRITDLAIGYQAFTHALWDGFSFEVDALVRASDKREDQTSWSSNIEYVDSMTIGLRAMVGYSFLITKHAFVAFSIGLSKGREIGTESNYRTDDLGHMTDQVTLRSVDRAVVDPEGFMRIGVAFGK